MTAKWCYVTGSHNFKAGFQYQWGFTRTTTNMNGDLFQQYQNGRPFQVTVYNTPIDGVTQQSRRRSRAVRAGCLDGRID